MLNGFSDVSRTNKELNITDANYEVSISFFPPMNGRSHSRPTEIFPYLTFVVTSDPESLTAI